MPTIHSWQAATEKNQAKQCKVQACNRPRSGPLSTMCKMHTIRWKAWGTTEIMRVSKKKYATELDLVAQLLNRFPGHEGFAAGVKIIDALMVNAGTYHDAAGFRIKVPGREVLLSLRDHGVHPSDRTGPAVRGPRTR
jgi:hypothetical protein